MGMDRHWGSGGSDYPETIAARIQIARLEAELAQLRHRISLDVPMPTPVAGNTKIERGMSDGSRLTAEIEANTEIVRYSVNGQRVHMIDFDLIMRMLDTGHGV